MRHPRNAACLFTLVVLTTSFFAAAAQADYSLGPTVVGSGGGASSGGSYSLAGTVGQPAIGVVSSAENIAEIGFWYQPGWLLTGVEEPDEPFVFGMRQNSPNPFNPVTTLRYSLASRSHVEIAVYDVCGRLVRMLVDEDREAGSYQAVLDGRGLPSGVYFARMVADKFTETMKMVLLK